MGMDGRGARNFPAFVSQPSTVDWTKILLLTALLGLSWWSTTQGLIGLITATNGAPSTIGMVTIGIAIGVLTALISWTLDRLKNGKTGLLAPLFIAGYALLTIISVGFGYGFYWTHIESQSAAQRAAETETERLEQKFTAAFSRLDESVSALDAVAAMSVARADEEAASGGTCGAGTFAGPGPRYRLRREDAVTMTALSQRIKSQIGTDAATPGSLMAIRSGLNTQLDQLAPEAFAALDHDGVKDLLVNTERTMADAAARYESFRTGPSVQNAVSTLRSRIAAGQGEFTDGETSFTCPDKGLEVVMTQAADALSTLPPMPAVELHVPLGAEATVDAFGKFANTALWPIRRNSEARFMQGRDFVPLGIAVAIDLFILLLSLHGEPRGQAPHRKSLETMLGGSETVHQLIKQYGDTGVPAHVELLEHSFWWRRAYFLALPAEGPGDPPLTPGQRGLTLAAMVLADAGLLKPLSFNYAGGQWREQLAKQVDTEHPRPMRAHYSLYRFEENGLARMTGMLLADSVEGAHDRLGHPPKRRPGSNTHSGIIRTNKPLMKPRDKNKRSLL